MEEQGYVSLWLGKIKNAEDLTKYVELIYRDEGDFLPSRFLEDFDIDIDDFDEDFLEKVLCNGNAENLSDIIKGCSYDNVVIPRFRIKEKIGKSFPKDINSAILLYNFHYDGRKKDVINNDYSFKYIDTVQYL